jgi:membrane-bound metal-dependent hydrolase YbcI (DUF457 family)
MFIGHIGAGLVGKRVQGGPSLGTYILAATFLDLLFPLFLLLGWERAEIVPGITVVSPLRLSHYPYSHSLLYVAFWAVLFAGVYWTLRRRGRAAIALGLVVASHWLLDFISHTPDMPLAPGSSARLGLGLWNSRLGTVIVEGAIFAVGVLLYLRATRPKDRIGRYALGAFIGLLIVLYATSVSGTGTPPNLDAFAVAGLSGGVLTVAWAYWIDRHREARVPDGRITIVESKV